MKVIAGLKEFLEARWRERFVGEVISVPAGYDVTPLADFLASTLTDWLRRRYAYAVSREEYRELVRLALRFVLKTVGERRRFSLGDASKTLSKIFSELIQPELKSRLASKGLMLVDRYDDVRILLGSELRWRTLKLLARGAWSARGLAEELGCREEVARRVLGELKRLGILRELLSLSPKGRPVKTYKLKTPLVLVDLIG